jgi:serine/threonine-protein kinase HipA
MKQKVTSIWVYADWEFLNGPELMGVLTAQRVRGKEVFSFEYEEAWMTSNRQLLSLDPNLGFYRGKQYLPDEKTNFGLFLDSSPDRWGRLLMRQREVLEAREENREEKTLFETDYLLGVLDATRMGALRFKLHPEGEFMNDRKRMATPPWSSLRELEYASLQLEREEAISDTEYVNWLKMLIDPGSSLGGARPKASIIDEKGQLWIAKFPSALDNKNYGAWEMVLNRLANAAGIIVPEARIEKFSAKHDTFLTKRFDRTISAQRLHYASAMTLLGYSDGTDHVEGVGYLDLAGWIIRNSPAVKIELEQLWRRLVFNILVSNTDDHLRNHGFLLTPQGWKLAPAFDMNPNEWGVGLTLNITEQGNQLDLSLALESAKYYRLHSEEASRILEEIRSAVSAWREEALKMGISTREIELTKRAFRLAEM